MIIRKCLAAVLAAALMFSLAGCCPAEPADPVPDILERYPGARLLCLNGDSATLDGAAVPLCDRTWKADPSLTEPQIGGTVPEETPGAYLARDIIYYPEIPASSFTKEEYDGEQEWVTRYTAEGAEGFLFGTLPVLGEELPSEMMHSAEEAFENPVLHITEPGTYIVEGTFRGQLFFDFGEEDDVFADEEASVTVVLNGTDVTCTVAPAIVFHDVYECDNGWEDREIYTDETDLSAAGVRVILADGTMNRFSGCNVYRLLKPEYKKNSTSVQKKLWKTDGAFYSFRSMCICGEEKGTGILQIFGTTFEGLDSELHLTVDGGNISIFSQDDGINVNEDHVSVFTMNGGNLTVFASLGREGDVIDSNGFIRVNGGLIAGTSKSPSDDLLDSEDGVFVSEDAEVIYGGSMSESRQEGQGGRPGGPGADGEQPPEPPAWGDGSVPPEKPEGGPDGPPPEGEPRP